MDRYLIKAYCKVNLHLDVIGKRADGYHNIYTIFQSIDLYDEITADESNEFKINIDNKNIPLNNSNTLIKAYSIFKSQYKGKWQDFSINLKKNIPIGSGLGGGSADGAAILRFLNEYYDNPFKKEQLMEFALDVGADVVFLVNGGTALGEGLGEKLTEISNKHLYKLNIVIVYPNIQVSTKWAYDNVKKHLTENKKTINIKNLNKSVKVFISSLKSNNNVFEPLIFDFYPRIKDIKNKMLKLNPIIAMMTGTGSAVFGIFDKEMDPIQIESVFGGNVVFSTKLLTRDLIKENFLTSM